jgi:DMSO/TMAO reductase YedYZ molybdopterin-dependent catalytic subunit
MESMEPSRLACLARSCRGAALLRPISASTQPLSLLFCRNRFIRSAGISLMVFLILSASATLAQSPSHPVPSATTASGPSTLQITGAVSQDLKLTLDDLKKMPRKSVSTKGHDDQMHQYDGVPIGALLSKAGVPQGSALRGKSMVLTVVAEGSDGYRAVFSLAELDEDFAGETVLIVDSTDGQPLSSDQGPLRLVVPGDKRQGRWVRMLKSITIINLGGSPSTN